MVDKNEISKSALIEAVDSGLSAKQKSLPSWLFYDETGDALFQQIMRLPEYYPTRCEAAIIEKYKEDILRYCQRGETPFNLIELGAGDGTKTEILLQHFISQHANFTYVPVDISVSVLDQLTRRINHKLPDLRIHPLASEYYGALDSVAHNEKKFILFMGANIGNFKPEDACDFLIQISASMSEEDLLMIGFDLKKSPRVISKAYDDDDGITRQFNLNLLRRLNRELNAKFIVSQFDHAPVYNPRSGAAESYLISLTDQFVEIPSLKKTIHFYQWETIHTEISQKYDLLSMQSLLTKSGLEIIDLFFDKQQYFCDAIVKKK